MVSTPLHVVVAEGDILLVKARLPKYGPNILDIMGDTPLHTAASSGRNEQRQITQMLLQAGAAVNVINRFGETPLDTAVFWAMRHRLDGDRGKERICKRVAKLLHRNGGVRLTSWVNSQHWRRVLCEYQKVTGDVEEIDSSSDEDRHGKH
ncbi:Ilk [Symbiodinium sp. CCMP2592]|nr:Ilk [Symbiodinium sp. CCMP2592]